MRPIKTCAVIMLLLFFASPTFSQDYPQKIKKFIKESTIKTVCETKEPRRVGIIIYRRDDAEWLARIFTKDGEELEIWFNKKLTYWGVFSPSKIFYNITGRGWVDKETLSSNEAYELDQRLKFDTGEMLFFKKCAEEDEKNRKK